MNDSPRFSLPEDVEALYESDTGPVDISPVFPIPSGQNKKFRGKTTIPGNTRTSFDEDIDDEKDASEKNKKNRMKIGISENAHVPIDDEKDIRGKTHAKGRYQEDELDEESYISGFGLKISGAYFDEKEKALKIEYKLLPGKDVRKAEEPNSAAWHEMELAPARKNEDVMQAGAAERIAYSGNHSIEKYAENILGSELNATYDSGVLNIEYKNVELINGQKTYQRIVLKAESDGESVYDLTMRKFSEAGIEASAEYDGEFGSMIFTSMNRRAEGAEGNFNEFYLNGDIGVNSADKAALKKGDIIEWRYAEETDGSCGGSPDFSSVKSALEYSAIAKMQAQHFGLLVERPYSASFQGFSGGLTFH